MILVVGATGALGARITKRLLAQGREVRILVRPGSQHESLVASGAQPVFGDLKDPESLLRACTGVEAVITTANSAARGGDDTVHTVEIQGNQSLIDAARASGTDRFLFVSALGADESSPVPFLRGKGLAERHLRDSGLNFTILEPNLFLEIWAGMLVGMPIQAGWPVTLIGEGKRRHSMISIADVAEFAVSAIGHPEAEEETLVLGGPEAVSWRDVVAAFERVIGRPIDVRSVAPGAPIPGLPAVVAELAAGFESFDSIIPMEEIARRFGVRLTGLDSVVCGLLGVSPVAPPPLA